MYPCSNDVGRNKHSGSNEVCEQHEKEFFSLFDFAAESTSSKMENSGSPLRSIHGAASAVFGGIWSALDTAIAILNEEMNMEDSTENILPVLTDDANDCDSLTDDQMAATVNCVEASLVETKSSLVSKDESGGGEKQATEGTYHLFCKRLQGTDTNQLNDFLIKLADEPELPKDSAISNAVPTAVQQIKSSSLSILGKCLPVNAKFKNTSERGGIAQNDDNVESDYCIIRNENRDDETNDGWQIVSDE